MIQNMLGAANLEFSWRHEPTIDPTVQRENLVAYVSAGMMTRKRAAEIMGETLPDDPMADVLAVTPGRGVVRLGGNSANGRDGLAAKAARGAPPSDLAKQPEFPSISGRLAGVELNKYNHNHDERGRFAAAGAAANERASEGHRRDTPVDARRKPTPQRTVENCAEEWQQAYERCESLLRLPNFHQDRVLLGGHATKDGCAKGFVSERCGGNQVSRG